MEEPKTLSEDGRVCCSLNKRARVARQISDTRFARRPFPLGSLATKKWTRGRLAKRGDVAPLPPRKRRPKRGKRHGQR